MNVLAIVVSHGLWMEQVGSKVHYPALLLGTKMNASTASCEQVHEFGKI